MGRTRFSRRRSKGEGKFTLKVKEDGEVKVYEVGAGLKISGELGKVSAITFKAKLEAGKTYVLDMISPDTKALDPFLRLLDADGKKLAEDDDSGDNLNARILFHAQAAGAYQVVATCFGKGGGPFTLSVRDGRDALVAQANLWGADHWKVIDYRLWLANAAVFAKMNGQQRALVAKANQLNSKMVGLYQSEKYREALQPAQENLTIRKEVLGEKHPDYARSLHDVAVLFYKQKNYAKAEFLWVKNLEIVMEVLGEKHPDCANSLNALASLYGDQGNYRKAEPLHVKALETRKVSLGEKHPDYAQSLHNLAFVYSAQSKYDKAEPLYLKALEIRKEVLGEKHPHFAYTLSYLANMYCDQGNFSKAERLHLNALETRKESLGEKHPAYALSLHNLASLYFAHGSYANAKPLYLKALEIRKQVLGEKHPDYVDSLICVAGMYGAQANYRDSASLYLKALEISKEVHGEKHADCALIMNQLSTLYYLHGDYGKSESLLKKALEIGKEVFGEKHRGYADTLGLMGVLYKAQTKYAKAEAFLLKALEIDNEVLGSKHPDLVGRMNNLASLYGKQRDYAKAEPLFIKSLELCKEMLGEKHPNYFASLTNLASLYLAQENYAKAEPLYLAALEIHKEVLGEKHPDYTICLQNLAGLYFQQGSLAKANVLFLKALGTLQNDQENVAIEQLQANDLRIHSTTIIALENHSWFLLQSTKQNPTTANVRPIDHCLFLALAVLDLVRHGNLDHKDSKIQLTGERYGLFPQRIEVLNKLFSLEQKSHDLEAAFSTAEQGSARAFLESLGNNRANILASVGANFRTGEQQLLQDIRLLDLRIDKESERTLDKRVPDLLGKLFEARRGAEVKLKQLVATMEKENPEYASLKYPRPCKLEEARKCLAADEVALLFVPGTDESFIVLVEALAKPGDKANGLAIIKLPGAAGLAEHVASLTDTGALGLPVRTRLLGRQAFDALLGPCKERIKDKNLVIVPNGALCFLPFELLVEDDGKYLVEKHRIRYAPSLTALHHIGLWKQKRVAPQTPLFAVGDPLYDAGAPPPSDSRFNTVVASRGSDELFDLLWRERRTDPFKRLVHSGKEITEIAKLFGAKSDCILTGADASEAKVKAASTAEKIAKARYVHFATHGILGVDKGKQPALVLNLVGNSGKDGEDGFLEYEEILNLKLNADLVVLSACRTGQGSMARGEGVTGLARAFLYAGSKGVVCSLWSVDDRETANLMVDFYGHLQKGRPAADALREAQLRMIREGKAPLYWAPFILIGE